MNQDEVKILLVDDEEEILDFLSYNLAKEGFKVYTAQTGKEAIKIAGNEIPDVIILDVMMPEMDGLETCKSLRENKELDDSLIAFLSARNDDYTKISGLEIGADDYIMKPIRPLVFLAKVKSLLRRKTLIHKSSGKIQVNNLKINLDKRKVKKDGQTVDLTKIEYKLLLILINAPDKIFSREEIYLKIWGTQILVGDRTLDVHVRNLRQKIGKTNIRTFKGVGYAFNLLQEPED
jgi:two-component system alkaline phosphatase synthesis response regulator PhoP